MCNLNIYNFQDLDAYLRANHHIAAGEKSTFEILTGGISNRVVLVTRDKGRSFVLKQPLAELRVQGRWTSDLRRIRVEAQAMHNLSRLVKPGSIPPILFEDLDNYLLAMGAVPCGGKNWKALLLGGDVQLKYFREFGVLIGTIHREGFRRSSKLARVFDDRSYFESLRLEPYYLFTARQVPEAEQFLLQLVDNTRRQRITLVHGDYSPKNILISECRLTLIDHEVVHFGDPAFDLGFSMTHFLSKALILPKHRSTLIAGARLYWTVYKEMTTELPRPSEMESRVIEHTIGCLLARARGRAPLEYLNRTQSRWQKEIACALIRDRPVSVEKLLLLFSEALERSCAGN